MQSSFLRKALLLLLLAAPAAAGPTFHMTRECFGIVAFGYELHQDGELVCDEAVCTICVAEKRLYEFNTFDPAAGLYSPEPLLILRVADFDADGNGIVGHPDFGAFTAAFGQCVAPNGVIDDC